MAARRRMDAYPRFIRNKTTPCSTMTLPWYDLRTLAAIATNMCFAPDPKEVTNPAEIIQEYQVTTGEVTEANGLEDALIICGPS